jgi:hypothetical protein
MNYWFQIFKKFLKNFKQTIPKYPFPTPPPPPLALMEKKKTRIKEPLVLFVYGGWGAKSKNYQF